MITDIIRLVHMECTKEKKKRIIFWSNLTRVRIVLNDNEKDKIIRGFEIDEISK